MKLNLMNTTMLIAGIVLIYAAIRDVDPRDLLKNTLQGKPTTGGGFPFGGGDENDGKRTPRLVPKPGQAMPQGRGGSTVSV